MAGRFLGSSNVNPFFKGLLFWLSFFNGLLLLVLHSRLHCPPSSKFIQYGILNVKYWNSGLLLIWVSTAIDNTILDNLRSTISGLSLHLNELANMHP